MSDEMERLRAENEHLRGEVDRYRTAALTADSEAEREAIAMVDRVVALEATLGRLTRAVSDRAAACQSVTPDRMRAYLTAKGWTHVGDDRTWAFFTRGDDEVEVPLHPGLGDYAKRLWETIEFVAMVEFRAPALVLADLLDEGK